MSAPTVQAQQSTDSTSQTSLAKGQGRVVVHALHKSASMFLFSFFQQLAQRSGMEYFSPNLPDGGRFPRLDNLPAKFCVCPQRSFVINDQSLAATPVQRIFHVRDPRDIIVSEYYAVAHIHPVEQESLRQRRSEVKQMTVDEYALNQPEFSKNPLEQKFQPLLQRIEQGDFGCEHSSDIIVKYETMVTQFHRWAAEVVKPFGFASPKLTAVRLAWKYRREFIPPKPGHDAMTHKRRITPGDFRNKLSSETVKVLNERFAPILETFGYQE